jgi:hypothetical protein
MAIAFVPVNEDPKGRRDNWLSMNKADELICEMFNEPVDPKHYCNNWFDSFIYFDWYTVKDTIRFEDNYSYTFETAEDALLHYIRNLIHKPYEKGQGFWEGIDSTLTYIKKYIEPIIRLIYDKGYQIVSLNIG